MNYTVLMTPCNEPRTPTDVQYRIVVRYLGKLKFTPVPFDRHRELIGLEAGWGFIAEFGRKELLAHAGQIRPHHAACSKQQNWFSQPEP
jgi:hypothetical protein